VLPAREASTTIALPQGAAGEPGRQHADARASPPETPPEREQAPIGAIAVTAFLTITILS
jgi:hypothetical protein